VQNVYTVILNLLHSFKNLQLCSCRKQTCRDAKWRNKLPSSLF